MMTKTISEAKCGSRGSQQVLVKHYAGYIASEASRWKREWIEQEDLRQVGAIGLLRATKTFDPDRGIKFLTYASHWIHQSIRGEAHIQMARGRAGLGKANISGRHDALEAVWPEAQNSPDPVAELQRRTKCTEDTAWWFAMCRHPIASLDAPTKLSAGEADQIPMIDTMPSDSVPPDDCAASKEMAAQVRIAVDRLPEREATLIKMRFFQQKTLQEVGNTFGISRERTRQVELRALSRLRRLLVTVIPKEERHPGQ